MPEDLLPVYRQLDYLAQQLTKVESTMIDPRDFGQLEGAVRALRTDVDTLSVNMRTLGEKMDQVLEKLSEAKGGWRVLMLLGGAGAALGGAVTWAVQHFRWAP